MPQCLSRLKLKREDLLRNYLLQIQENKIWFTIAYKLKRLLIRKNKIIIIHLGEEVQKNQKAQLRT